MASVFLLDVAMKEGNLNDFQVDGGIGLIASRFSVQGPIKKDKASFIVSGRRTYIDALVRPFVKKSSAFYGSGYYFYDINASIRWVEQARIDAQPSHLTALVDFAQRAYRR